MYYVNILTSSPLPVFLRQFDSKRFGRQYVFFENSKEDRVWDFVVVYEEILSPVKIRVRNGGLIFFSGESQCSRFYSSAFLRQFARCVTTHASKRGLPNHIYAQTALNWHFGYNSKRQTFNFDFDDLESMASPKKTKNFSVITSSIFMMFGHARRLLFIKRLKDRYGGKIDFFGKGFNFIEDKAQALLPYRFHICIENSQEPHYWTEKFADALLGFCVPVYFGDPKITQYFPEDSLIRIDITKPDEAFCKIDKIMQSPEDVYSRMLPAVVRARKKLMSEYNFFSVFDAYVKKGLFHSEGPQIQRLILPNDTFMSAKIGILWLRMRRLVFRTIFKHLYMRCK